MIKMIASDLDGTLLLNGAQKLPEEIFDRIRDLKKLGIEFVAASGRQFPNMYRMFKESADDINYICENGAIAIYEGKVLYEDEFDKDLLMEIVKTIWDRDQAEFTCSHKDYHYLMPKTKEFENHMLHVVKNDCKIVNSLDEITEPCVKAAVYEPGGNTEEGIEFWRSKFGDRCVVVTSGNQWMDFIPFGTNKAKGVKKMQEVLGVKPEECIVFGDEYNDIEMLKSVKYSFAMSHSKQGVKSAAAYETPSVLDTLQKLIDAKGDVEAII
ncbi:MAG: HAD family hydrolase [Eubacteriales bacterium]|nr:HAD family hydrolase [Eubacteriales bacterium]